MTSSTDSAEQASEQPWVAAGRVGRPHGLDGSFHVTGARPRLLRLGALVDVGGKKRPLERRAGTDRAPILRLGGVSDRDAVAALRGEQLLVCAADAPALPEGEWWAHQLEGCDVRDGAQRVGTVLRLLELPSCEALEIARSDGGAPLLVPMVSDAVRSVDVESREIDVDLDFLGERP